MGVCVGHGQTDAGWYKKLVLCSRLDRPQHYVEYQRIFNVLCQFCFIMADKQAHSLLLFEQRRVAVAEGSEGDGIAVELVWVLVSWSLCVGQT